VLGGSSTMPPQVRDKYTECERAALAIAAREVKRHGICNLSVGQIAAEAGDRPRRPSNAARGGARRGP
jgi:AcrR family transcriptional regulator